MSRFGFTHLEATPTTLSCCNLFWDKYQPVLIYWLLIVECYALTGPDTDCMHIEVGYCFCSNFDVALLLCLCPAGATGNNYRMSSLCACSPTSACCQPLSCSSDVLCLTGRYTFCVQTVQEEAKAQERVGAYAEAAASYTDLLQADGLGSVHDKVHMQDRRAWCLWQSGQAKAVSCCIRFASVCKY